MQGGINYENDSKTLRTAMKGMGTDEDAIIKLTGNRSNTDRMQIRLAYKTCFGRDLLEDLEDELSGDFKKVVMGMWKSPVEYDTEEIYLAMKGAGTNEDTLSEIIGSRSNQGLAEIKTLFKTKYGKTLESWIEDEASGDYRALLVSIIQCNRDETTNVDYSIVSQDAKDLYDAGEGKCGTDEEVFNRVFAKRNNAHLTALIQFYKTQYGKNLFNVISSEFSSDIKVLLKTVLMAHTNPVEYFAERIYNACKGWGTNDNVLIRSLISTDEAFMSQIKAIYKSKYGVTLEEQIKDETSGDYKKMLLELVAH
jgi:hypothetical protein